MNDTISEKDYPIENIWILKTTIGLFVSLFFVFLYFTSMDLNGDYAFIPYFIVLFINLVGIVVAILSRLNFHYMLDNGYLTVKQGILSKQERHIPYGVIQHVFVKRDLLDRLFGLASLAIENASSGGKSGDSAPQKAFGITMQTRSRRNNIEMLGFSGNKVNIPGLTKDNAESLKLIILQKMKENPIQDSQSGL